MKIPGVLIVAQIFLVCVFSSKTSSYIKPCSKSAPDFEQCCLEHGKFALPYILKGDKSVGIPNMLPLVVPEVKVNGGPHLKIFLKNVHVYGLDNNDLKQVKIDVDAKKIKIKVVLPKLELIGKYEMDGKILILPIKGNGNMNITAMGGEYVYNMEYSLEKIKGVEYLQLTNKDKLNFELQNVIFKFENLFDGDKKLGDQMNKFLNENWKDILKELGSPISGTVRFIAKAIAVAYFKKIPYHDLLLN